MRRCSIPRALSGSRISMSAARKRPVRSTLLAKSRSMRSATHAGRKSRHAAPSGRVRPEASAKASAVFHSASERRRSNSGAGEEKRRAASAAATPAGRRRLFSHASDTGEAKTVLRVPATGMNAYSTLEIVAQGELNAAGLAGGDDPAEERAEIGIGDGNAEIRVVERVEELGAKLDRRRFARMENARERQVENNIARTGNDVAAGIAEGVGGRLAEGRSIEPVLRGTLVARQRDLLAGDDVGPIECAGVGEICGEVESVLGHAVLDGNDAAGLPVAGHRAQES